MLHTDEFWEVVEGTAVLREIMGLPGLRQFTCVEIPVNTQLFHLDINSRFRNQEKWTRFIFDDIREILPLLKGNKNESVRLSLQTRRQDDAGYSIVRIDKILSGTIVRGWDNYAFLCSNKIKYYESIADLSLGEFSNARVVWPSCA
jgi:hypothetical protein